MEGVAAEAASLVGHLKLGNLIYLYDDNGITLAASTQLTFTEDHAQRFAAYGWHTQSVEDGNDLEAIDRAIRAARQETEPPSLILVRTHIGYGSPHKQDSFAAHGSPLGEEEVKLTKQNLGWPVEPLFLVPKDVGENFGQALDHGREAEAEWNVTFAAYEKQFPELAGELRQLISWKLTQGWDVDIPQLAADPEGMATRAASGKVLNALKSKLTGLVVGHALAWELVQTFLGARFSGAERHRRRLAKVAELENKETRS
jgi:transketolase